MLSRFTPSESTKKITAYCSTNSKMSRRLAINKWENYIEKVNQKSYECWLTFIKNIVLLLPTVLPLHQSVSLITNQPSYNTVLVLLVV